MGPINKLVVVGAGISGLASAFRLEELGIRPLVLEASDTPGGIISTVRKNGFVFEGGPQFPRFPEPVWRMIRSLQLENEFVAGDAKAKRYILRDGHLHLAPFSAIGLLSTGLVSVRSKYLILSEAFRSSRPPDEEETLAEFVDRKFGPEVLDYLVDPVIATIFFGDAGKMGMGSAFPALVDWERTSGSVARGAIRAYRSKQKEQSKNRSFEPSYANSVRLAVTEALPTLGSFRSGMATLPEKLADRMKGNIQFGSKVESIRAIENRNAKPQTGWFLRLGNGDELLTEALVLAIPAYAAASLLESCSPKLASLLNRIAYAALGVVSCAYRRSQVSHRLNGFGFMVPRREGLQTICTFWNSSLFREHAPDGMILMTSYVREKSGVQIADVPDDILSQTVHSENAKLLGITGAPVDRVVWKYPRALPQYTIGHSQRVAQIREALAEAPGLYLAGNFLNGRSIGDCAREGFRAAEDAHRYSLAYASNNPICTGDR